jgi:DNA polymerase-3 subunit gamma/tau
MAVTEIDAASHGKVADMEKLRESLYYSNGAGQRLVILDEAHAISREGFKSMLKTFEEAPPGVTFILVTTEFRKIPETIISRAMRFTFKRIPFDDIVSRLEHINLKEDFRMEEDLVSRIAEASNGSLRDAIMLMDKLSRVDITKVSDYEKTTGAEDIGPKIFQAMMSEGATGGMSVVADILKTSGDAEIVPEALTNLLRDLMLLRAGRPVARQGEALEVRKKLAASVDPTIIMNSLRVLWDIKTKFQHSEAYYEVYLAVSMIGDLFGKTPSAKMSKVTEPVKKMDISELTSI